MVINRWILRLVASWPEYHHTTQMKFVWWLHIIFFKTENPGFNPGALISTLFLPFDSMLFVFVSGLPCINLVCSAMGECLWECRKWTHHVVFPFIPVTLPSGTPFSKLTVLGWKMIILYQFSLPHLYIFSPKVWEKLMYFLSLGVKGLTDPILLFFFSHSGITRDLQSFSAFYSTWLWLGRSLWHMCSLVAEVHSQVPWSRAWPLIYKFYLFLNEKKYIYYRLGGTKIVPCPRHKFYILFNKKALIFRLTPYTLFHEECWFVDRVNS